MITLASNPGGQTVTIDQGTDATTRDTLYFTGISTNLNVGDALLIVSGQGGGQQSLRIVESVSAQADQQRTEVTLQEALPTLPSGPGGSQQAVTVLQSALGPFIADATDIFSGGDLATEVATILQTLIANATVAGEDRLFCSRYSQLDSSRDSSNPGKTRYRGSARIHTPGAVDL